MRKNAIERKIKRDELKSLIRYMSFTDIGKRYGVSYTTIKGWCKHYNLPHRKEDIKLFDDLEWEII